MLNKDINARFGDWLLNAAEALDLGTLARPDRLTGPDRSATLQRLQAAADDL